MNRTALLIIDVQQAFDDPVYGQRNNPQAEDNIALLLADWRRHKRPVIHIRHDSAEEKSKLRPGLPGNAIKQQAMPVPGEPVFGKSVNSAFIGTGLEDYLRVNEIDSLVVAGLTTDHCVSTSVRMAGNLGFDVTLVADATATFERTARDGSHYSAEDIHAISLLSLDGEFCAVKTTAETLNT